MQEIPHGFSNAAIFRIANAVALYWATRKAFLDHVTLVIEQLVPSGLTFGN
jgi:hypothetical protein